MNALQALMNWYSSQCNGDWEHSYGADIGTLDNPGWALAVDLTETGLEERAFAAVNVERSEVDWIVCRLESTDRGPRFVASGGARNLEELLQVFLDWSEQVETEG